MTINDIQAAMRAKGSHWWDPDTMRFFGTRVSSDVFTGANGVYFVTSEKPPHGKRGYTVRRFEPTTADIDTASDLCEFKTRNGALASAKRMAGPGLVADTQRHCPITPAIQFLEDVRRHGKPNAAASVCDAIRFAARRHHRVMELLCSDEEYCRQVDEEGNHPQVTRLRGELVTLARKVGADAVLCAGDPRGCTVKLTFADGYCNDFAKEGYCVPID